MLPLPLLLHHSPLSFLLPPHPPRMSRQSSLVAPAFFSPYDFFLVPTWRFFCTNQPVSAHHPQTQPPVKSAGLRWWSAFTHTGRQAGRQGRSAGRQRILFLFLFLFPFSLSLPPLLFKKETAQLHSCTALAYNSVGPVIHTQRSTPSSSSRIA